METEYHLTKSARKFIRSEKARIRDRFLDFKKQEELISELYKKALGQTTTKESEPAKPVIKEEVKKAEAKKEKSVPKPVQKKANHVGMKKPKTKKVTS